MDKTVVVAVKTTKEHPIYRKKYKVTTKFKAHDDANQYKVGDLVEITETRPMSREKHFEVSRKISVTEVEA
jgi:small subunit ribosomal protein S17